MEDPNKMLQQPSAFELSERENAIVESLRQNGLEGNVAFLEYDSAERVRIDEIQEPQERQMAQHEFDIRKALMVGRAGDLNYADEILFSLGKAAFIAGNKMLEDKVNDAMDFLGLD